MDDTTATATPSSTAASAAAVADTKDNNTHGPEGNLCAPNKTNQPNNTNSVELVIKSSNQQYDDIVINSDLQWSVKRLKQQLSLVYPGKPLIEDQKLIYSGKLLKDKEQLFEIIRSYKDVFTQNHVVHLVCAAKNLPIPLPKTKTTKTRTTGVNINNTGNHNTMNTNVASDATADGVRERQSGGGSGGSGGVSGVAAQQQGQMAAALQHQQQWQTFLNQTFQRAMTGPENITNAAGGSVPTSTTGINYGQQNIQWQQAMAAHQSVMYNAWMQQVYAQYMHQVLQGNSNAAGNEAGDGAGAAASMSANPFVQQQMYFMNSYFGVNPAAVAQAPVLPSFGAAAPSIRPQQGAPQEPANVGRVQAARNIAHLPRRQARQFPNIHEDPENRDWLDNFFALTRMGIFLTILYFNSSPLRCILVVLIASSIYLYHIGVLRRRRERNNNNLNRNNNANAAVADEVVAEMQRIMDGNEGALAQPVAEQEQQPQPQQQQQQQEQQGHVIPPNRLPHVPAGLADAADVAEPADVGTAVEPANSASVISVVRTFVITFFTSLLPEAPAL